MVKSQSVNAGDVGLIPGSGRSSGEGNCNPLQYSCLENLMDSGTWPIGSQRVGYKLATKQQQNVQFRTNYLMLWD